MVFGFCAEAVFVFFPQDSPLGLALIYAVEVLLG
jgi:hypothetical protein